MSATAADLHSYRVVGFWQSTNGKKVVMALTGVMMFLFVIGHLLGNLLVFQEERKSTHMLNFCISMTVCSG